MNLLLEALWLDPDGVYLNPGVRWAHDLATACARIDTPLRAAA